MKRTVLFIILVSPLLCGCAKLAHLQQLLTLKHFTENQDKKEQYVQERNASFEALVQAAQAGELSELKNARQVQKRFGSPVLKTDAVISGRAAVRWLYRHPIKYFDTEKVYIFFDEKGNMISWEHVVPPQENVAKEPS